MALRRGFTLVEILIVVVIMAILAAVIIPQYTSATSDAQAATNKINLKMFRGQIALYRAEHNGVFPGGTLGQLLASTDLSGNQGTGPNFPYGPYLRELPLNTISNSRTVKVITSDPATAADVNAGGGWLYNATTGGLWINDSVQYKE